MNNESIHGGSLPAELIPAAQAICDFAVGGNVGNGASSSTVEPLLPKQNVAGSNPVSRSEDDEMATEGGHWYLPDGSPFYTVPRASNSKGGKKGEPRPVSLRFDRKVLYAKKAGPSVTTVSKIIEKPALNAYHERNVFEATMVWCAGNDKPISEVDFDAVFKIVKEKSREHGRKRAAGGTELHGAVEHYLLGGYAAVDRKWRDHIEAILGALEQYGLDIHDGRPEHSFFHPLGYGGKVDFHQTGISDTDIEHDGLVLDFKSKERIEDKKQLAYDEHAMQIAAYREGLRIPNARGINIFVGEEDREVRIHEWKQSDLQRGWKMFQLLFRFWQVKNNYYPKRNNKHTE